MSEKGGTEHCIFLREMLKYLITAVLLEGELTGWRAEQKCFSFIVYKDTFGVIFCGFVFYFCIKYLH